MKNAMLTAIPKSSFIRLVLEATNDFRAKYNAIPDAGVVTGSVDKLAGAKKAIADSSVSADLKDLLINALNCVSKSAPDVPAVKNTKITFVPYACVVPLRNRNHHKYTIGEAVIMTLGCPGAQAGMYGMNKYGVVGEPGNELPRLKKSIRPATNAEIFALVDKLYA